MKNYVYVICYETAPAFSSRVQEVCSTEEKAWQRVEQNYYKLLNFLQAVGGMIANIKIDGRTITIRYLRHLTHRAIVINIFKRPFNQ